MVLILHVTRLISRIIRALLIDVCQVVSLFPDMFMALIFRPHRDKKSFAFLWLTAGDSKWQLSRDRRAEILLTFATAIISPHQYPNISIKL